MALISRIGGRRNLRSWFDENAGGSRDQLQVAVTKSETGRAVEPGRRRPLPLRVVDANRDSEEREER